MATHPAMKKSWSRGSDSTQFESPARFCSPLRWDAADSPEYRSPENSPGKLVDNSMAVVAVDKLRKLSHDKLPQQHKPPENAVMVVNRPERDQESQRQMTKMATTDVEAERRPRSASSVGRTAEEVTRKAALGFRLCEVVVCLISFSVMAANKTQGWSGDSYDRYKEYRYEKSHESIGVLFFVITD
ncbi:CASP-like protein at2g36330-like protein [Trifolium pratense]|uniref:CASP-like protein n=1 Tax=Trifolium pratense TaxID=57577 RepID=A0A2K3LT30_TRIPR|nr:CASP-like protein at2g36330-like protein [Trifolium pratense]